jgi:uncharacterized surface protein with fasciclin (FAS1) repeats
MKKLLVLLPVAGLFVAACSPQTTNTTSASPTPMMVEEGSDETSMMASPMMTPGMENDTDANAGVMVGGSIMMPSVNIVQNAMKASNVTTLVSAVQTAGLAETLQGPGPFTVFAPTNAAFDKVPKATLDNLMLPANRAQLVKILTYHAVPGRYLAADLKDGMKLKTVQGQELTVSNKNGKLMIMDAMGGSANVETKDVISSNGVTFVVQSVLMPK